MWFLIQLKPSPKYSDIFSILLILHNLLIYCAISEESSNLAVFLWLGDDKRKTAIFTIFAGFVLAYGNRYDEGENPILSA
jgi:hypothetical protein